MSIESVAEKIKGEKRKEIMESVISNKEYMESKHKYHPTSLPFLFAEWHRHFPNAKQSIKSFVEENIPGMGNMFKPKSAHEFVDFLGRLGSDARKGRNISHKVLQLSRIEDMDWIDVETREVREKALASKDLAAENVELKNK